MAFFSGTDERDDRSSICYSGVVGKLNTDNPEIIFRFNAQEKKVKVAISDIFGDEQVAVPREWLDKVTVAHTSYAGAYQGNSNWGRRQSWQDYEDMFQDTDPVGAGREVGPVRDFRQGLNRKERRALTKINAAQKTPNFALLPQFSNPSLKHLKREDFQDDQEPGEEFTTEVLNILPEFFNNMVLKTEEYPTLLTVAIYGLIGGLTEDFYVLDVTKDERVVKMYSDKPGQNKEYMFASIYKEFVMRPYFHRREPGLRIPETEINEAVKATVEDAWDLFLSIQI